MTSRITIRKLNRRPGAELLDPFQTPGPWWTVLQDGPRRSATVRCPKCGCRQTLTDHEVHDDGAVVPSLQCSGQNCDWHVFAVLAGWEPAPPPNQAA